VSRNIPRSDAALRARRPWGAGRKRIEELQAARGGPLGDGLIMAAHASRLRLSAYVSARSGAKPLKHGASFLIKEFSYAGDVRSRYWPRLGIDDDTPADG
jgi:hypothetical protein